MQIINSDQQIFLETLIEWRILDYKRLASLSKVERYKGYDVVKKLIHRLKAKHLVKIYHDPWSKRGHVYLSNLGEKLLSPNCSHRLSEESLYHDSKVSLICYELMLFKSVISGIELEHIIKGKSKSGLSYESLLPDARFSGRFKGQDFQAAIEVELNQKEKSRIISKAKFYYENSYYDNVFYFFPTESLMKIYSKIFKESIDSDFNLKIFLFHSPDIFNLKGNLGECNGFAMNKKQSLYELFEIFPMSSQ